MKHALEIFESGLWLVGGSVPSGVYMSDRIEIGLDYAGRTGDGNGGIVLVQVEDASELDDMGEHYFVFQVPHVMMDEYLKIDGIEPVGVLDINENRIR